MLYEVITGSRDARGESLAESGVPLQRGRNRLPGQWPGSPGREWTPGRVARPPDGQSGPASLGQGLVLRLRQRGGSGGATARRGGGCRGLARDRAIAAREWRQGSKRAIASSFFV